MGNSLSIASKPDKLGRLQLGLLGFPSSSLSVVIAVTSLLSRLAFAAFLLLTSVYCLLVWVPFAYFGFIRNPLIGWIPVFVRLHGLLFLILLLAVGLTLVPACLRRQTRRLVSGFFLVNGLAAIYLLRAKPLATLQPDLHSYIWSMLSLFPLLWLTALDLTIENELPERDVAGTVGSVFTATWAGVTAAAAFLVASLLNSGHDGGDLPWNPLVRGWLASLCSHVVLFLSIGLLLDGIRWLSRRTARPARVRMLLTALLAWFLMVQILRAMILPTISFEGMQAAIFAAVVSFVLVLFAGAFLARARTVMPKRPAFSWQSARSKGFCCGAFVGILAIAYGIPAVLGRTDWDFVLQRMAVMASWLLIWQIVRRCEFLAQPKVARATAVAISGCALLGFAAYAKLALYNPFPSAQWQAILDNYSGLDISFKTVGDILSRRVDGGDSRGFYAFLKQNTNLDRSVAVAPVSINLVSDLRPTRETKPNIFIFVIDSLRQDFVSPYNPAVDYTPEIGRFAADSVVMQNAYTRYGGTALSEPAIWAGAMQLHKQYIEPFYPMNNLQKLLDTDGYQSYISVDPILRVLLHPSPSITELDTETKSWNDLDFVPTLKELEQKIDARPERSKPIFAYTQPQNVHTLTLERSKIPGGRKAVSIYELRRMDAAFGEFLGFLRQRGLYDNSIVILTADHGDCYGEFGRWGHSDFLFPQVIRIPLIFHLPARMRRQFVTDSRALAFTTDITPSLYYLLGHSPILNHEMLGRPLFTESLDEQKAYRRSQYLIVASYAPVYAILSGDGQNLFIADAVNSKNYDYNLVADPEGTRNHVTLQVQNEQEALIRHYLEMIEDFYHWHPGA